MKVSLGSVAGKDGVRFIGDSDGSHYSLRFAGRPMVILEAAYRLAGGTPEKFMETWKSAKSSGKRPVTPDEQALAFAGKKVQEFMAVVSEASKISEPFCLYVNSFDARRARRN